MVINNDEVFADRDSRANTDISEIVDQVPGIADRASGRREIHHSGLLGNIESVAVKLRLGEARNCEFLAIVNDFILSRCERICIQRPLRVVDNIWRI